MPRTFLNPLHAHDRYEAIAALAHAASAVVNFHPETIAAAVRHREQLMPTGVGYGIAVPHARLEGITTPMVAVGLSRAGIDFDAADGLPAQLIFLLLTAPSDEGAQLDILAEITKIFRDAHIREHALQVNTFTEFLALLKSEGVG